ncbi:response regulator transcription factor [Polyangium jinanense]|uniref:Response regulator n=1 Tax=Polyangium jinanense TaxID=2829994 RepID=A0A9X3WZ77_9BACT|nr:response regulator [Polyangium jinanense]MDC3953571.1 response regulator [Polyangium jinanense]MDC3979308.1 response regulator [Polyangium jinanense]
MASTILAVDDSVTMRKVLEITFAGPEFRCVAANGHDAALEKLKTEKPALVIADVTLEGKSGYDLCKAIKQASPATQVLILSSKQNPYDQAKGSAAQADDHIDKPYDSTAMIDKVKKMLASPAKPAEAPKAAAPVAVPTPVPAAPAKPAAAVPTAAAAAAAAPPQRAKTMLYNPGNPGGVNAAIPGVPPAATKPEPALAKTDVSAKPGTAAAAAVNGGQMAARLEEMGLTPAQIEGVLALSREVVERVVWEVVPVLAETLIKEEIARLTK